MDETHGSASSARLLASANKIEFSPDQAFMSTNGFHHTPSPEAMHNLASAPENTDATLQNGSTAPEDGGRLIVLSAPLTETIDHAGYFIQMALASLPMRLEGIINNRYPEWRQLDYNRDGSSAFMPAGVRAVEAALLREYAPEDVVAAYPDDIEKFIGPRTRLVALSTHNPLGVTFAAGVYTSIFGTSKEPINSHYAMDLFRRIQQNPFRENFRVIVGGSGGWQLTDTGRQQELGVDCVVDGRAESADTMELIRNAILGEDIPEQLKVEHPKSRDTIVVPKKRTTFGVVEMTTGCGRRCKFCIPDLNPQLDVPKAKMMGAVRASLRHIREPEAFSLSHRASINNAERILASVN
jgi:hypothetical protein